jgi:hypothetical protein
VDGARVDVRLQDYGYKMPTEKEFSFEVDPKLTIMQDALSTRGGKQIGKGGLFIVNPGFGVAVPPQADRERVYAFGQREMPKGLGVPLRQALARGVPLSAEGRRQLKAVAQAFAQVDVPAENAAAALRANPRAMELLDKAGLHVALKDYYSLGKFKREIDMSKDPKMYSFDKDRYELIVSFNPRTAPDFVQDRLGWSGEGLTDKRDLDTASNPGVRMLKRTIVLSRDDILGPGKKVLAG